MKKCSKCKLTFNLSQFHKRSNGLLRADCAHCVREYGYKYRAKNAKLIKNKKKIYNKERPEIKRNSYLKLEYGLSLVDYENMYQFQNGKCGICNSKSVRNKQHKHFHIDHCHKTGKIRGLLCSRCNAGLGHFSDKTRLFEQAIKYLRKGGSCGS